MRNAKVIADILAEHHLIDVGQYGSICALLREWGAEIIEECAEQAETKYYEYYSGPGEIPVYVDRESIRKVKEQL